MSYNFNERTFLVLFLCLLLHTKYIQEVSKMKKRYNFMLEEETMELIRKIAKQEDKKHGALIRDMLQCYLIINAKDRKD